MSLDDSLQDHFENAYWQELERRNRIHDQLTIPIGIVIALGGVLAIFIKSAVATPFASWGIQDVFFAATILALSLTLFITGLNLFRAYRPQDYAFINRPDELDTYVNQIISYLTTSHVSTDEIETRAKEELQSLLIKRYRDTTRINNRSNNIKSNFLDQSKRTLSAALLLFVACATLYVFCQPPATIHKAEIVNISDIKTGHAK